MGDDAEYYIEQQESEAQYEQACWQAELDRNKKLLYCWVDGHDQDIWWDWEPMTRVLGIFSKLHNLKNIGSEYFLASSLPEQEYKAVNERQQAGWTALSAASQQSCPLPRR